MARLILDTGVLVAGARGALDMAVVAGSDDVALPAVVVAEYLAGVLLTVDEARRTRHRLFLERLVGSVPVVAYDEGVAEHHAELLAYVRRAGKPRGPHDLIIAATARATERTILTRDARARFDELPGVQARVVN